MRTGIWTVFAVLLSVAMVTGVQADSITLGDSTLGDLLGEGPLGGTDLLVTDMSNSILHAQVFSQALPTEWGDYVYLYQVNNTGTGSDSSIELFTLVPFVGAGASPSVGWLTGDASRGLLAQAAKYRRTTGYINPEDVLSFYFTERAGARSLRANIARCSTR